MLENLKQKLKEQYDIDRFVFLEDLEHSPSSTLYRTLSPFCRDVFEPNYRFVFFNFSKLQKSTLDHIVSIVDYLDISRCFVLIVTDQQETVDYFNSVGEPFSLELVDYTIEHSLPENPVVPMFPNSIMCAHAWSGLHVSPTGVPRLCCDFNGEIADSNNQPYNIQTHSLDEILSSDYVKNIRDIFRKGETPKECKNCTNSEATGGESKRRLTPYKLENIYGNINWESDQVDNQIGFLGGHLGNLCNLKCRICSPVYSSKIAVEVSKYGNTIEEKNKAYQLLQDSNWAKNYQTFWTTLKEYTPQLYNFEILGGEPLMWPENLNFMQYLIDTGQSKRAIFEFITNGTQYPAILDQASEFRRLTITISIDNTGPRFEYERSGANWELVEKNVDRFIANKNKNKSLKIGVCITINIQNVFYLPELIEWINHKKIDHYYYNFLNGPDYLCINDLTPTAKKLVLDKLESAVLLPADRKKLDYIINRLHRSATSDGSEFCRYMREKDIIRNENFSISHPEIANAMGYVL
jgi:hypothetical protein